VPKQEEIPPQSKRRINSGPRRARTVEAYLRHTRAMAILVVAAVIASVASDLTGVTFWERRALVTNLVASVLVVMWTGVLDLAGLLPTETDQRRSLELGAQIVRDTSRLTVAVRKIVDDDDLRSRMHTEIAFLAEQADEVLGRWAAVMLNAEVYAEVIDRHVELAGDLAWIGGLLDARYPPDDVRRQRRARSSAAVQIEAGRGNDWLADRIVVITQLAEDLDRGTVQLALQIVPVQWWEERLGTNSTK
jgi:hypothetical protein